MRHYRYLNISAFSKNALRSISGHWSRFFALFAIIALGAGAYSGLRMFAPDMYQSASVYYQASHFSDARIYSPLGFTQDDLDALHKIEQLEGAMPVQTAEISVESNSRSYQISLEGITPNYLDENSPNYLNRLTVLEGRLPQAAGEIIISNHKQDLKLGEKLRIKNVVGHDAIDERFVVQDYTIVGFIHSPEFISSATGVSPQSGVVITNYGYVLAENFKDPEIFSDIFIRAHHNPSDSSFSESYAAATQVLIDEIKHGAKPLEERRRTEIQDKAQKKINDGQAKLKQKQDEAEEQFKQAEEELQQGRDKLAEESKKLQAGKREYQAGKEELALKRQEAEEQFSAAQAKLDKAEAELKRKYPQIVSAEKQQIELNKKKEDLQQKKAQLTEALGGYTKLDELQGQLAGAQAQQANLKAQEQSLNAALKELQAKIAALDTSADPNANPDELAAQKQALQVQIQQLEAQLSQLLSAQQELNEAERQLSAGIQQLQTRLQAAGSKEQLEQQQAQLNAGLGQIDQGLNQIAAGLTAYYAGEREFLTGKKQLEAERKKAEQEFIKAERKLANGKKQLENGKAQLAEGEEQLHSGEQELAEQREKAQLEFAKAQIKIDDAIKQKNDIPKINWYVLGRNANPLHALYEANVLRMQHITTVFPIFFFLVAGLVSLITMTRMVESERIEIGSLKAIGYTHREIARKYLGFGFIASSLGSLVGIAAGVYFIPKTIWLSYKNIYPDLVFLVEMHPKDCIIAFIVLMLITLGSTYLSSRLILQEAPTKLMIARAPKPGKRILLERIRPLWNCLSFTSKVTARNLFRYKKRLVMTVLGVSGCTCLLITGFGISDHIKSFVPEHYFEVNRHNITIGIDNKLDKLSDKGSHNSKLAQKIDEILGTPAQSSSNPRWIYFANIAALSENKQARVENIPYSSGGKEAQNGGSTAAVMREARSSANATGQAVGVIRDISICIPEGNTLEEAQEKLSQFIQLKDLAHQQELMLNDHSVIITQRLAENLQLKLGDTFSISLLDSWGEPVNEQQFTVGGIAVYYVGHKVFMTKQLFEQSFGEELNYNFIYAKGATNITERQQQIDGIKSQDIVSSITIPEDAAAPYNNLKRSLNMLVTLIIFLSGALALIVLYNLTNINIEERRSEIATLKVLGFHTTEIDSYVFRETFFLSVCGIICGLPLGKLLCTFIMRSAEMDDLMFMRHIVTSSYILACIITLGFTFLVMLLMHAKLKGISMVSSLKAID